MTENELDKRYPEHAKLQAVVNQSQAIGEFIANSGYVLAEWDRTGRYLLPVSKSTTEVLAEYFDINMDRLYDEKDLMLVQFREMANAVENTVEQLDAYNDYEGE